MSRLKTALLNAEAAVFTLARRALYARAVDVTERLSARRTLVLAPHPDDETLGCGAAIARLRQAQQPVRVVIVTDGRGSHRSAQMSPDDLARLREAEAVQACAVLGVAAADIRFLQFADGTLTASAVALAERLAAEFADFAPEQLLYPSGLDGHPDHRALAAAAEQQLAAGPVAVEGYAYPVWFWNLRAWLTRPGQLLRLPGLWPVKLETAAVIECKRSALGAHRSQFENLTGEADWDILRANFTRHFFGPYEIYFRFRRRPKGLSSPEPPRSRL